MSMYNDIAWGERGTKEKCIANAHRITVLRMLSKKNKICSTIPVRTLVVSGSEKKWFGTPHTHKPDGEWDKNAEGMVLNFAESGHPAFRATSALERGELRSKEKGKKSTVVMTLLNWFFALLFLSISSVSTEQSQIRVRNSWPETSQVLENIAENEVLESVVVPTELPVALRLMPKYKETCCVNMSRSSQNFLNTRNWPNYAPTLVSWRILEKDNSRHYVESTHYLEIMKNFEREGGFVEIRRSAQSWAWSLLSSRTLRYWDHDRILISRPNKQFLGFASWMESTTTWLKRQKKFLLKALSTDGQGNLSRMLNHGQSPPAHCLVFPFFFMSEN